MKIINFPMLNKIPIVVADISRYNATGTVNKYGLWTPKTHFNFDKYHNKGGKAIIFRGGVSTYGADFEFLYNLNECDKRGIYFWIYHYTKLYDSIDRQAANFSDITKVALRSKYFVGMWLDIEDNNGLTPKLMTNNFYKLMERLSSLPVTIGIYTRASFWDSNLHIKDAYNKYPYWIAHYYRGLSPYEVPKVRPLLPEDWMNEGKFKIPYFWQFDTHKKGYEWGSTGEDEIDLNFFVYGGGTTKSFKDLFGIDIDFAEIPEHKIVNAYSLFIRSGPFICDNKIGYLLKGSIIPIVSEHNGWSVSDDNMWINLNYAFPVKGFSSDYTFAKIKVNLNIRDGGHETYNKIGLLKSGSIVPISEVKGEWGKIAKFYISSKYLV